MQAPHVTLGTDGFGCSDTRPQLRAFFEVDTAQIVRAALVALAHAGRVDPEVLPAVQMPVAPWLG